MNNGYYRVTDSQVGGKYDLVIASCGFERRSRLAAELNVTAIDRVAYAYVDRLVANHEENRMAYMDAGFDVVAVDAVGFRHALLSKLRPGMRLLIDISTMTRVRLASVVEAIFSCRPIQCEFVYGLAEYTSGIRDEPAPDAFGPVSRRLSGWPNDTSQPISVVCGLGYEFRKALGALEMIDPQEHWLFRPRSPIVEYDREVDLVNDILLSDCGPNRLVDYAVDSAESICATLFPLIAHLQRRSRVVIVPFGPKIFAVLAMIGGIAFSRVAVYRMSSAAREDSRSPAVDRNWSGKIVSFSWELFPPSETCEISEETTRG